MLTTIAFDADDTLWKNNSHFNITEETFVQLLQEYSNTKDLRSQLLEIEIKNLDFYGFGVKGFTLSMIETAIKVTQGRVPTKIIAQLLDLGRELLRYPIELYSGVFEVIQELHSNYQILLITKGDLLDQERKISQSGLAGFFDSIEIVSEKTSEVYKKVFEKNQIDPKKVVMIGNSVRSDILPPLENGCYAIFIPNQEEWAYEQNCHLPANNGRYYSIKTFTELPSIIEKISKL